MSMYGTEIDADAFDTNAGYNMTNGRMQNYSKPGFEFLESRVAT